MVPALEIPEAERPAREGGIDEAQELGRLAEEAEVAARPQALPVLAVDHLVRHHPRRRHEASAPETKKRRHADERGDERDGGRGAAHACR